MPSFIIRGIDAGLMERVKARAEAEGVTVKAAILTQLERYVRDYNVSASVAMEWGFRAGEKGWNLDKAAQEFALLCEPSESTRSRNRSR